LPAKRDVLGRLDGVAAELAHRNLKRRAGPQRRLFEEQRDVKTFERLLVPSTGGTGILQLGRARQAGGELGRPEIQHRQEPRRRVRDDRHFALCRNLHDVLTKLVASR
jgi:hypothetical protein